MCLFRSIHRAILQKTPKNSRIDLNVIETGEVKSPYYEFVAGISGFTLKST